MPNQTAELPELEIEDEIGTENRALFPSCELRSKHIDKRQAEFVASTQNPVDTFFGPEVLKMSGLSPTRFKKNPVILDSHNRGSASGVIGNGNVKKEGSNLIVNVTFAETGLASEIMDLIDTGFVRAVSVGFIPKEIRILEEKESMGVGINKIVGPARVVTKSELFEISVVSVPADGDALKRSFFDDEEVEIGEVRKFYLNKCNIFKREFEMPKEEEGVDDNKAPEEETPKGKAPVVVPTEGDLDEELAARRAEATKREVMATVPSEFHKEAERMIFDGKNLEEIRTKIKEDLAKRQKPAGTPEAEEEESEEDDSEDIEKVDGETIVRSL